MSLTAISSLESARKKFFMNSTHIMSRNLGIKRFCAQEAEMTLTAISSIRIGERKIFHELDGTSCLQSRNQTFFGLGRQK